MKKVLMLRMGGVGDVIALSAVAKALNNKGYIVDYFCGSPTGDVHELLIGLDYINQVKQLRRLNGVVDCVQDDDKNWVSVDCLFKDYDQIFDFKNSIENNKSGFNVGGTWCETINSNYQNWTDLSLSWVNIDPSKIHDNDKRPEINYDPKDKDENYVDKYFKWVFEETPLGEKEARACKVIGIQLQASSLVRSWYRAGDLPKLLHERYPDDIIVIFANDTWFALTSNGRVKLTFPEGNQLAYSTALIEQMNVFISADSGMSHIAEAVHTPTISIYTTVPAWTRIKYYKYAHPLEATTECHPCFTLDGFCPLEKKNAIDSLDATEKDIFDASNSGTNVYEVAKKYNTIPRAIIGQFNAIKEKLQSKSAVQPQCVGSITPDMIINKVEELIKTYEVIE
jgi:ADP-heptose:LPS heptosyltransferase